MLAGLLSLSKQLPSFLLPPFLSSSLQHRESGLNNNKNDDNNNVCQTSLTMNPPNNLEAEAGKASKSSWPFHICQGFFPSVCIFQQLLLGRSSASFSCYLEMTRFCHVKSCRQVYGSITPVPMSSESSLVCPWCWDSSMHETTPGGGNSVWMAGPATLLGKLGDRPLH